MAQGPIRPGILAISGIGGLLLWSGLKGKKWTAAVKDVIGGKNPAAAGNTPITGLPPGFSPFSVSTAPGVTPIGGSAGSNSQNQSLGKMLTAAVGWTGAQWDAFNQIAMHESGWSATAANPTSSARGIAQNINGWSSSYQSGNARQQILWMIAYIKGRYGNPVNAWAFWQAHNSY